MSITRTKFRFVLIAAFVITAVGVGMLVKRGRAAPAVNDQNQSVAASERGRVQIVSFTLYDVGIYPHEARANPGAVTIFIEDLTASSSGLIVERVEKNSRTRVGVIDKASERLRSRGELHLGVGHYELVDASRPENRALLIVEPDQQ